MQNCSVCGTPGHQTPDELGLVKGNEHFGRRNATKLFCHPCWNKLSARAFARAHRRSFVVRLFWPPARTAATV